MWPDGARRGGENVEQRHVMSLVDRSGSEMVFLCDDGECRRRVMIDTGAGRRVVIDQGDRSVPHGGGTGHIVVTTSTVQARGRRWSVREN
jgi:hypothetical protein